MGLVVEVEPVDDATMVNFVRYATLKVAVKHATVVLGCCEGSKWSLEAAKV